MGPKLVETIGVAGTFVQQARGLFNTAFPSDDVQTTRPILTTDQGPPAQTGSGSGLGLLVIAMIVLAMVGGR